MTLTLSEREIVLKRLDEYPAGVSPKVWGFGPMATKQIPFLLDNADRKTLKAYG